jgi:hypothetical protein
MVGCLVTTGCGGRGDVSGKVTFDGEPIPWGRVFFHSQGNKNEVLNGRIINGQYSVAGVPTGPVKIAVESIPAPKGSGPGADDKMTEGFKAMMKDRNLGAPADIAGKFIEIPARYANAEESGLAFDVSRGAQTHDLPLTP